MTPEEFFGEIAGWDTGPEGMAIATPEPALLAASLEQLRASSGWARSIPVERVSPILAPHIGMLGYLRAEQGRLTDSLSLDANYVRRADAELKWKDPVEH